MTIEKIYKSLTKNEFGTYKGSNVDNVDGKIFHILIVNGEEREVSDSTFKRWWKLVEETTQEDLQESLDSLNQIKDTVLKEQPTIEDLKQLNESGVELTEEELQLFKEQAQQEEVKKEKVEKKPKAKKQTTQDTGVAEYFESQVRELGGSYMLYSEPMKRVVKNKDGKTVIFYMVRPNKSLKIYFKDQLDEVISGGIMAKEEYTYPRQFPFRLEVKQLDETNKNILNHILSSYL